MYIYIVPRFSLFSLNLHVHILFAYFLLTIAVKAFLDEIRRLKLGKIIRSLKISKSFLEDIR